MAGQPVELELWLGGEGFVRLSTGFQGGLDPPHHSFPVATAATGGEAISIEAEVVPKGMLGTTLPSHAWSGRTWSFLTSKCGRWSATSA